MKFVYFTHSLASCWNHGNAHFLRGILSELLASGHQVSAYEPAGAWSLQNLLRDHGESGLRAWRDELGTTLLLIEHNMRIVQAVADRVCVLDYGSKLAEGEPRAVLSDPAVLEAYLGREASKQVVAEQTQGVSHVES